jgi:hypothetical protein
LTVALDLLYERDMKLSDDDKKALRDVLKATNNLPPAQGRVIIDISPESKVVAVEINIKRR